MEEDKTLGSLRTVTKTGMPCRSRAIYIWPLVFESYENLKRRTQGKVGRLGNIQLIIVELKRLKIQKNQQAIQLTEVWAEKGHHAQIGGKSRGADRTSSR